MTELSSFITTILGLILFVLFPILFVVGSITGNDDDDKKPGADHGGIWYAVSHPWRITTGSICLLTKPGRNPTSAYRSL